MKSGLTRVISFGIALLWLSSNEDGVGQGTYGAYTVHNYGPIVQTVWYLTDTNLAGFFGTNGIPVFTAAPGGPYSVLSVDLNHDGIEDYRVVATGSTEGFDLDCLGQNAVWARPAGVYDFNSWVVPLAAGTLISETLPAPDRWTLSEGGPGFSAYSWSGGIGLFVGQTAYAGLRFYIGSNVHYGWIKIQELPWLCGGGIVYEYAYDIRPGMPVYAGVVPEPTALSLLVLSLLLIAGGMRSRVSTRSNYVCPK